MKCTNRVKENQDYHSSQSKHVHLKISILRLKFMNEREIVELLLNGILTFSLAETNFPANLNFNSS